MFFPRKKYFPPQKKCLPFFYASFQCGRYNVSKFYFFSLTTKSWKNHPKKLLIIGPDLFFFSAALTAQNSPELHFRFINSSIQSSLLRSLVWAAQHSPYTWFLPQTSQKGNECVLLHKHCGYRWIIMLQKCGGIGLNGFILKKINENLNIKETKRSWGPFRIYQLISTANLALFECNWAELAVLISW